ncbi:MAG: hypothetical protein RBR89_06965, partial [Candidatus Bipolaricaulis sp.]|nr:hypothetical protein [Candidatus Bipolaricaulis sp.]
MILEKDKYSLDTFADREGLYVHYYESINLHNTSFIFGLGWGVYAVHKRLIDLLVDSVVYQKGSNSFFDTITMQR